MFSKSRCMSKSSVANIANRNFAREEMLRKLVTFDSGSAIWALGDKAYMSLFLWARRIPGCVGAIALVDCDR